ncbi:MAG: VOC family protein [Firmicutes bacterium]|nr:VOC family protein [Bacillota bacterium]
MIKKINHVGIAVKDIDSAIEFFEHVYEAALVWRIKYEDQQIDSALIAIGESRIEITASLDPQSSVAKFISARGEGIHHISLEVERFDQVIEGFRMKGLTIVAETDTEDFKAAFIHPSSNLGLLTEIIEPKKDEHSLGGKR